MSAEITLFENAEFGKVRVVMRDGEPWFVANDVAAALGYVDPKQAVRDHCKYAELLKGVESLPLTESPRGINIIPESDVYALIFRSNLPKAEEFRRWVCEEVLPSIRKTGQYTTASAIPNFSNPAEAARAWADAYEAKLAAEKELTIELESHEHTKEVLALTETQRDKAIREKAWIGTHREASAMGTASAATKRANNWKRSAGELADVAETQRNEIDDLNDQLGCGYTWMTVKAIPWLLTAFKPSRQMWSAVGKALVKHSKERGIPPHEAPHAEFGTVKSYHIDVIESFRHKLTADPKMLWRYRRHHEQ